MANLFDLSKIKENFQELLVDLKEGIKLSKSANEEKLKIETEKSGFQYICAINSDIVPYRDFSENFSSKFDQSIRIKLTDEETGGLLGFRF